MGRRTDSVDTTGGRLTSVTGLCCGLTAPEAGTRTGETSHAGTTSLMYSGSAQGGSPHAYLKAADQSGNQAHPAHQCGHPTLDAWNHVTVNLATNNSNKQINRILVGYDQPNASGGYRGYIDDITIS